MNRHVFGPLISRRLGRSLGIDLLPHKTCSYNCVYCECGATTDLTINRKDFFPPEEVIAELDRVLAKKPLLDYITFAGSGEPTLSNSLGLIIRHLKNRYPRYRVAVLTNGTLCSISEVRNDLLLADLIIPTIPASDQRTQDLIFRPHHSLSIPSIINGLIALINEFTGQTWAEIFLVPGINTNRGELQDTRKILTSIQPDLIQLNSLDRPGTESWVNTVGWMKLIEIKTYFAETGIPVEIIGYEETRSDSPPSHEDLNISGELVWKKPSAVKKS